MAESMSGLSDWLPQRARWARDFLRWSCKAARRNSFFFYIVINPLLTNLFRLRLGQ